jgi:hypothetical protein
VGGLQLFWRNWEKHRSDLYIIQLLREGYRIPFRYPLPVLDIMAKHLIEPVVDHG